MANGECVFTTMLKKLQATSLYWLLIPVFFALFFWPATLAGRFFVGGDALVYSYPLRMAMWEMIRHGQLPLWTPTLLGGYPLLSMSQLAVGYPLTWFYLILPGHAAEQIYVLAPFLLMPIFTYVYARETGRSRTASLLAGLTFGFGGLMASQIATYGILPNAVMWLPLVLVTIERARSKPFVSSLLFMTAAYAMSVLSGLGQGFLYVGIVAIAYASLLSLTAISEFRLKTILRACTPLFVCVSGIVLAACLSAFQILETMQAQQRSIRSKLSYEIFSGGAFTLSEAWGSFVAPFYHFLEEETFVVGLAAVMAPIAVAALFKGGKRDSRLLFWLVVALISFVMMLGNNTPLYRLLYHVPLLNLFRVPARHAFEWTFALAILAAYGWDQLTAWLQSEKEHTTNTLSVGIGVLLAIATLVIGYGWWAATGKLPAAESTVQHTGLSEQGWITWKAVFTVTVLLSVLWNLRQTNRRWRSALLIFAIGVACFVEPYILLQRWWFHFAKPSNYFTQISSPSKFLQQFKPEENRIYTSLTPGYNFDLPRTEPHNISVRHGFHNAAGYEPLMPARYDKAFGNGGSFLTPNFNSPLDRQILSPNWQVLDLLNVRFLVEFSAAPSGSYTEKAGARFSTADAGIDLKPGKKALLSGASAKVDTLTIVSLLGDSGGLNDGQSVAEINIHTADGRVIKRELQAGRDSAEWAHERADVKPLIRHRLAQIFDSRPGDEQNSFPAYRYWAKFDLGEKLNVDRIEIANVTADASAGISKITAYDSSGDQAFLLTQRLADHWRKLYDYDNVQIYENPRALPRVWLVPQARIVSEEEALKRIRGESEASFDPRQLALFEKIPWFKQGMPDGKFEQSPEARIVNYEANRLVIETKADKVSALVVSESNAPGWEATIDGKEVSLYTTDYLLRGVIVPEGSHRVEMRYTATKAKIGAAISMLTLLLIAGLAIRSRRR